MTDEDKKLVEWCGLKWYWDHNPECHCGAIDDDDSMRSWYDKDGNLATGFYYDDIELDPNFLVKYAVPKGRITEITFMYSSNCVSCDLEANKQFYEGHCNVGSYEEAVSKSVEAFKQALLKLIKEMPRVKGG